MGNIISNLGAFFNEIYPPPPTFSEKDIPDLSGKVMIVTGGNTGIGRETVRVLLLHNAKVYVACRSEEKANKAIEELKSETGKSEAYFLHLDLASLESVKKAAEEFKSKETKLDVLFNNAGVMSPPIDLLTSDGYDLQFGTNVVGHFLFTILLLPVLRAASKATPDSPARVVTTSSLGHRAGVKGAIVWESLKPGEKGSAGDKARRKMGPDVLYYQSKSGNILMTKELAKRYGGDGIVFTSLHPGTIVSELGRHWSFIKKHSMRLFLSIRGVDLGAITQLYAGTAPEGKDLNGKYLIPWARIGEPREDERDPVLAEKLYKWLEEEVKAYVGPEAESDAGAPVPVVQSS